MSQIYLFADVDASQNSNQAYGPVDSQNFRVQSKHNISGTKPAIAVVSGEVFAVQDPDNSDYVNVILRPDPEELTELSGFQVAFMVYKRVLKSSLLDLSNGNNGNGDQWELVNSGIIDLIDHLREINDELNNNNQTNDDPGSNMLGLHLTDDNSFDDEPIDWLLRYDNDFDTIRVNAGDTIGNFEHDGNEDDDCAFEIYIHRFIEDHPVSQARSFNNKIEINSGVDDQKQRHDREKVLNYLDPAAFYGLFCEDHCTVIVKDDNGENKYQGRDAIFNDILKRFHNKDALYLDIRNDNFYSYNFYDQFDIDSKNFKYEFEGYSENETLYGSQHNGGNPDDWPIQIIRTDNVTNLNNYNSGDIDLKMRLVHYPNAKANIFINRRKEGINGWVSFGERILRFLSISDENNEWTSQFSINVNFQVNEGSLVAGYHRILYNKTDLVDESDYAEDPFPKKGVLDNLFPIVKEPDLNDDEDTKLFVTGYERFVNFDPNLMKDDHQDNIPYEFYGLFKFAYLFEKNNSGENRVQLIAFAEEVFFLPSMEIEENGEQNIIGKQEAEALVDQIQGNTTFSFQMPGEAINPSIMYQKVDNDDEDNEVPILRFEPGPFTASDIDDGNDREVPNFNLQTNYLSVYLTQKEYDRLKDTADGNRDSNFHLDEDYHLRFLKLEDKKFDQIRQEFEGDEDGLYDNSQDRVRYTHYYRLPLGVKGMRKASNGNGDVKYAERDGSTNGNGEYIDFSDLHSGHDSLLRSYNKLVFSTPVAAANALVATEIEEVSDFYFILPDEMFLIEDPADYHYVNTLKKAVRDVYSAVPNEVSAVWSKFLHEGKKMAIGLFEEVDDENLNLGSEDPGPGFTYWLPLFKDQNVNELDDIPEAYRNFPYVISYFSFFFRGFHYSEEDLQNSIRFQTAVSVGDPQTLGVFFTSKMAMEVVRHGGVDINLIEGLHFVNPSNLIGDGYRNLNVNNDVDDIFDIADFFLLMSRSLKTDVDIDLFSGLNEIQTARNFQEEMEQFALRLLDQNGFTDEGDNSAEPFFNANESSYHSFFNLVFNLNNDGNFSPPSDIRNTFEPYFMVERYDQGDIFTDELLNDASNVLNRINTENDNPDGSMGPFYFYGTDGSQENDQLNNGYENFDQNNFPRFNELLNNIGENFSYDEYIDTIKQVIRFFYQPPLSLEQCIRINNYYESKLIELRDRELDIRQEHFPDEEHLEDLDGDYRKNLLPHGTIALNKTILEQLAGSSSKSALSLEFADVIAHELGHALGSLVHIERKLVDSVLNKVHRAGEPGTYFPNYPYSKGGGHFRGSFHGYLACDMENKAMKFLNRKYNQMGERESRRINRHQYYSDPNDHNLPDDSQHGYCYNNLDPINH